MAGGCGGAATGVARPRGNRPSLPGMAPVPGSEALELDCRKGVPPARPVPGTGNVRALVVWNANRVSSMTSFMMCVNSGSN